MDLKYLPILLSLLVIGCSTPHKLDYEFVNGLVDNVAYTQDKRTGLCFAIFSINDKDSTTYSGLGAAEVPCDKVKDHLQKPSKRKWP